MKYYQKRWSPKTVLIHSVSVHITCKWQILLPLHVPQLVKSLPFHIPEDWKRYPFRVWPTLGHYRYPQKGERDWDLSGPSNGDKKNIDLLYLYKPHKSNTLATLTTLTITAQYKVKYLIKCVPQAQLRLQRVLRMFQPGVRNSVPYCRYFRCKPTNVRSKFSTRRHHRKSSQWKARFRDLTT